MKEAPPIIYCQTVKKRKRKTAPCLIHYIRKLYHFRSTSTRCGPPLAEWATLSMKVGDNMMIYMSRCGWGWGKVEGVSWWGVGANGFSKIRYAWVCETLWTYRGIRKGQGLFLAV